MRPDDRPLVLTWGLIGPGKGIEWAIDAMAGLRDLQPRYLVMGRSHPKVVQRDGEAYRDGLVQRARDAGVHDIVELDDRYLGVGELAELVRQADVVLLPYDSREQVTSGVLIEAVAAGRPVVSTAFPHAIELLADGTGLVVPQRDPAALEAALRRVLSEPGLADGAGRAGGAQGARAVVGGGGRPLPRRSRRPRRPAWRRPRDRTRPHTAGRAWRDPAPIFTHLRRLTDAGGLYEHAEGVTPRREHGYCLDDVARALVVVCREEHAAELDDLREQYLTFVLAAQEPDGRFHNRRQLDLTWSDTASVEDCWGRALWGLGTAVARVPHLRERALAAIRSPAPSCAHPTGARWRSPRSERRRSSPCCRSTARRER